MAYGFVEVPSVITPYDLLKGHQDSLGNTELGMLARAWHIPVSHHHGKLRQSGDNFSTHALSTSKIVAAWGGSLLDQIIAVLHDEFEDNEEGVVAKTKNEIMRHYPDPMNYEIICGVEALTKPKLDGFSQNELWQMYRQKMWQYNLEYPTLIAIKMSDRLHNLETVAAFPDVRRQIYLNETLQDLLPLCDEAFTWITSHHKKLTGIYRGLTDQLRDTAVEKLRELELSQASSSANRIDRGFD